jgi:hypothetical protein
MEDVQFDGERINPMKEQFSFNIQNTRAKQIRLLANLILFLNAFVFLYLGFKLNEINLKFSGSLAALIILFDIRLKQKKLKLNIIAALSIAFGYYWMGNWYLGILFIAIAYLAELTASNKQVLFSKQDIQFKAPFTRTIQWIEMQNVILKDGLLTVDFKNNKLLQTSIMNELNEAEIKQFNDFCNERLKAEGLGQKA